MHQGLSDVRRQALPVDQRAVAAAQVGDGKAAPVPCDERVMAAHLGVICQDNRVIRIAPDGIIAWTQRDARAGGVNQISLYRGRRQ